MAIQHYDGKLGTFDYDDDLWETYQSEYRNSDGKFESKQCLRYIGSETDGLKIHIPEGIKDCSNMFNSCSNLKTSPVIPNGVINCDMMFYHCDNLRMPPVIPQGVKDCSWMFYCCGKLEDVAQLPDGLERCRSMYSTCRSLTDISLVIPGSAKNCDYMFYSCGSLTIPPVMSEGVERCNQMFYGCENLRYSPAIPKSVNQFYGMFHGCEDLGDDVMWCFNHRGESYHDFKTQLCRKYYPEDMQSQFESDTNLFNAASKVAEEYEKSGNRRIYKQIIDGISGGVFDTCESINSEMEIANRYRPDIFRDSDTVGFIMDYPQTGHDGLEV